MKSISFTDIKPYQVYQLTFTDRFFDEHPVRDDSCLIAQERIKTMVITTLERAAKGEFDGYTEGFDANIISCADYPRIDRGRVYIWHKEIGRGWIKLRYIS